MRAAVHEDADQALRIAPQHQGLVQQLHAQRRIDNFVGLGHGMPEGVFDHGGNLLLSVCAAAAGRPRLGASINPLDAQHRYGKGAAPVQRMNAKAARRRPWRQRATRPAPGGLASVLLAVLARHLAFHALDVEVDAREELVLGHGVGGQQFLACLLYTSDAADE